MIAHLLLDPHDQKPKLTEALQNSTVMVGQNASFHCEVLSGHPQITWFQGYFTSYKNEKVCKPSQNMIDCQLDNLFVQDPDPVTIGSFPFHKTCSFLDITSEVILPDCCFMQNTW